MKSITRTGVTLTVVLVAGITAFALAGPVFGSVTTDAVESADRSVANETVSPGATTQVTVDVTLTEESDVGVVETFDPAFAEVTILDDDGAFLADVTDGDDELFADYSGVTELTLVYEVTVPSDAEDGDTYTIASGTESDVDTDPVTVEVDESTPFFDVSNLQPGATEVEPGEQVDVSATITNTGQMSDEQPIELQLNGDSINETTLELDSYETKSVTFQNVQLPDQEGQFEYTVSSADDSVSATFDTTNTSQTVSRTPTDAVVAPGSELMVTVEATTDGDDAIDLISEEFSEQLNIVDSNSEQSQVITDSENGTWEVIYLSAVDSDTVEVTYEIPNGTVGQTFTASGEVITQQDTIDSGTTTIEVVDGEPSDLVIEALDMLETVPQGQLITVNATVSNQGGVVGTQIVRYDIDGEQKATRELNLANNETQTVELTVDTTDIEPGEYSQSILTDNDSVSSSLEITYSLVTYSDAEGNVGTANLREAINDWREERIGTDLLRTVIESWRV